MWLNECFLNSWHHNCEISMKMYWKSSEKFRKCIEKFKCSCNLYVTKVDNSLEITSRFFIFATRNLWNYLVQLFLVGFSSFLLSNYTSLDFFNIARQSLSKIIQHCFHITKNRRDNTYLIPIGFFVRLSGHICPWFSW